MSAHTKIEWADATWNVVLGCDRVSPGCQSCYAIGNARVRESNPNPKIANPYTGLVEHRGDRLDWSGRVNLIPDRLPLPLRWQKPKKIFVTAQSDVWHAAVSDDFLAQVFAVMAVAPRHVFQVLTKRPGRMRSLLSNPDFLDEVRRHARLLDPAHSDVGWPLPNVWLGVSAEDARWARVRIPVLLETKAAVRFVSAEPLLGPITLCRCDGASAGGQVQQHPDVVNPVCPLHGLVRLDWVIAGGESGRNARPMHPDWARHLRDQCRAADVAFLFKQWGEWAPSGGAVGDHQVTADTGCRSPWTPEDGGDGQTDRHLVPMRRVGKRSAGRRLDGLTWDQYPHHRASEPAALGSRASTTEQETTS